MALTKEDRDYIIQIFRDETQAIKDDLKTETSTIGTQVNNLWAALRGNNGDGIVTTIRLVQQSLKSLEISVRSLIDQTDTNKASLQRCQLDNIPKIQQALEASSRIEKTVSDFVETVEQKRKDGKADAKQRASEYGSWAWFRDKRIDPVVLAIVCYITVELVKYFTIYRVP